MKSIAFIIDGFNVYHSALDVETSIGHCVKWLNLDALCRSFLPLISNEGIVTSIQYLSAYAFHTTTDTVNRHKTFVKALESTGIEVMLHKFSETKKYCKNCKSIVTYFEEKKTDVAMGVRIMQLLIRKEADIVIIVSGDSDLIPAIVTAKEEFPNSEIISLFPYRRANEEIKDYVDRYFRIKPKRYMIHQFPDEIELEDGTKIIKPPQWVDNSN
jgi:uncharacterized LabA/DUF88 family protein